MRHDIADTPGQVADDGGDVDQPAHDHGDLNEVEYGNRQHAAQYRVGQYDGGAQDHALVLWNQAAGDGEEDQAQCLDLCRDPSQIRDNNRQRAQPFNGVVIA